MDTQQWHTFLKKAQQFVQRNYKRVLLYTCLSISLIVALWSLTVLIRAPFVLYLPPSHEFVEPESEYRLFDGHTIVDGEDIDSRPFAVVIENHVDSRPAAGLEDAGIVYETVVEGDITRYLALFSTFADAKKIGPIRSARPFFVDLAEEWDAVLFHAGGSPEALEQLRQSPLPNINEISGDGIYFWRDATRSRPHNLFTSVDQVNRALNAKSIATSTADLVPWIFTNGIADETATTTQEIEVSFFDNPYYEVSFQYDNQTNKYTRYLGNSVHKTASGIILKADTVIVQHVDSRVTDDYGRRSIELTGQGDAEIYLNGDSIAGVWRNYDGRTQFYDERGQEVTLNRGVTWIILSFN